MAIISNPDYLSQFRIEGIQKESQRYPEKIFLARRSVAYGFAYHWYVVTGGRFYEVDGFDEKDNGPLKLSIGSHTRLAPDEKITLGDVEHIGNHHKSYSEIKRFCEAYAVGKRYNYLGDHNGQEFAEDLIRFLDPNYRGQRKDMVGVVAYGPRAGVYRSLGQYDAVSTYGKVSAKIDNTILSAEGPQANAAFGVEEVSLGASLAEVQAGPLQARLGFKLGIGKRGFDLGFFGIHW